MSPDSALVGMVRPWVRPVQINQYNFKPKETFFRHGISSSTLDRHRRDAMFDDIVNKGLDCKNFHTSAGIVTEQDIKGNENPVLVSSDGDHKESFKYLVCCQKIDLMILQDPIRDIAQHLDLHIYDIGSQYLCMGCIGLDQHGVIICPSKTLDIIRH